VLFLTRQPPPFFDKLPVERKTFFECGLRFTLFFKGFRLPFGGESFVLL
jgi:hypothetical protein